MRSKDIPPHLHARYGIRPPSPWRWVAVAAALLIGVPVLGYAASRYVATQQRPFALISWASLAPTRVEVEWQVQPSDELRWCAIRAQDFDRFDVGYVVVPVEPGRRGGIYVMRTIERPLAVDVVACDTDPYALPGPQFLPGALPPRQVAPGLTPGVYDPAALGAVQ